jgi:hypothetical protein
MAGKYNSVFHGEWNMSDVGRNHCIVGPDCIIDSSEVIVNDISYFSIILEEKQIPMF